jgi:hypothetical protein
MLASLDPARSRHLERANNAVADEFLTLSRNVNGPSLSPEAFRLAQIAQQAEVSANDSIVIKVAARLDLA